MATSKLKVDPSLLQKAEDPRWALAFARIESHYFVNAGFFPEGYILDNVDNIRHIPTTIVQVREITLTVSYTRVWLPFPCGWWDADL